MRMSNQEVSEENLKKLRTYFASGEPVPERHGTANISAIALGAGVRRAVCYHDLAKPIIAEAVARYGLGLPNQQRVEREEVPARAAQRIHDLEQQVVELRARLSRFEHLEQHMTATGMLPR